MSRNAARCWNPYLAAVYDVGKSAGVGLSQFLHLSTISGAARGSTQFMFAGDITIYCTCRSLPASLLPRGLVLNFLRVPSLLLCCKYCEVAVGPLHAGLSALSPVSSLRN